MFDKIVRIQQTNYYVIETAIALLGLLFVNLFFVPEYPAFYGISPSPYWIVPISMAARYGRKGAVLAGAATAIVFTIQIIWMEGGDIFIDDPWLIRYPFLFPFIAFLIGEVKTSFLLREEYLTSRVEELQNADDQLKSEIEILKEANRDLSASVATQGTTITTLNDITAEFKSLDPSHIIKGLLKSFNTVLDAEECSFYSSEGNTLKLQESFGWKDYYKRPDTIKLNEGLVGVTAGTKEPHSIKEIVMGKESADKFGSVMGDSLLAIPVVDFSNELYGVISIEKIELLKLTDSTIQKGKVVCELASAALNNAYSFKKIRDEQISDEEYNLYKYHYLVTRLKEEFRRSANYMLPLSIVAFKWDKLSKLPIDKRKPTMEAFINVIRTSMRAFDVLSIGPTPEIPMVLLLATTPKPQAEGIKEKLIEKLKDYKLDTITSETKIEESIVVESYNPNRDTNPEDMLRELGI